MKHAHVIWSSVLIVRQDNFDFIKKKIFLEINYLAVTKIIHVMRLGTNQCRAGTSDELRKKLGWELLVVLGISKECVLPDCHTASVMCWEVGNYFCHFFHLHK